MPTASITGVRIRGLAACVPRSTSGIADVAQSFGEADAAKLAKTTGVSTRRIADANCCTSDLCAHAGEALIGDLGWGRDSIDALITVTQTPDHILPATACLLQHRLGLPTDSAAFDVNLGCSGYVYGLWLAASLAASAQARRVLLLVGDTISRATSPLDRSVAPLFGDAGTATAIEATFDGSRMSFSLGTDGSGGPHLIVPAGGSRYPRSAESGVRRPREDGNIRSDEDIRMDGAEVFAFTVREVPRLLQRISLQAGWDMDAVDAWVLHQANEFMIKHLARKAGLRPDRVVVGLGEFGNTSSASIPLALITHLRGALSSVPQKVVLAGFGVGFSWAAAGVEIGPVAAPALLTYEHQ